METLDAISPMDGRYWDRTKVLSAYFSEHALQRAWLLVEIKYLFFLSTNAKILPRLKKTGAELLESIYKEFNEKSAARIKEIEKTTNHDVKAVEYYLRERLREKNMNKFLPFVHFGLTTEDINENGHAILIRDALKEIIIPKLDSLNSKLKEMAASYAELPLLARTHGQPASPTTLGKEFANYYERISAQIWILKSTKLTGKLNGATGNFNAHFTAYPKIDWPRFSSNFIESLGLEPVLLSTQILPKERLCQVFDTMRRINNILIDLNRNIWMYISFGYFRLESDRKSVGSSTMPHKVNPIDFENSEGNLETANALFSFFSDKLPKSRMQRDLSDRTVRRNIGVAFAHSLVGYIGCLTGLEKIRPDRDAIDRDLEEHYEVLSEAVQTVLRREGHEQAYETIKDIVKGKRMSKTDYIEMVQRLDVNENLKKELMKLTPHSYIGLAKELTYRVTKNGKG